MSRDRDTEKHTDLVLEVAPPEVGHLKKTRAIRREPPRETIDISYNRFNAGSSQ